MRTGKIMRSKTEKKENRNLLPQLRPVKRLVTLNATFTPSQNRKMSQNFTANQCAKKGKSQLKKIMDQNFLHVTMGKNTVKFSRKKFNNESLLVQQINNSFSTAGRPSTPTNVLQYGLDQYQGLRDYNQDRILTGLNVKILGKIYNIFGVFDGHGGAGSSQFVKNNFIKYFDQQMKQNPLLSVLQNLRKTFNKLEDRVNEMSKAKMLSGGTCASVLLISQNQYYIVHVGDSRILKISNLNLSVQIKQLTTDHKPEQKQEKIRIQSVGGKIYRNKTKLPDGTQIVGPYRVFPGRLSVSRTIGDYEAKKLPFGQAISWQPQLIQGRIQQKCLFLLYTDGAYQKFQNTEIAQFFVKSKTFEQIEIKKSMQSFLINSILKQSSDNISLVSVTAKPISI